MGRIRTLKPDFFKNEELSALPPETHILAAGLLCLADDEGFFKANPNLVAAEVFPLRECSVSPHDMLSQLSKINYLRLGTGEDGKRYGQIVKFLEHQRINRPTPSKIKPLQIAWDDSLNAHGVLTESSLPERKGKEGNGKEESLLHEAQTVSEGETVVRSTQTANAGTDDLVDPAKGIFLRIPLSDDSEYDLHVKTIQEWEREFLGVDVRQEIRSTRGFWLARPAAQRKARHEIRQSLRAHLAKKQDEAVLPERWEQCRAK